MHITCKLQVCSLFSLVNTLKDGHLDRYSGNTNKVTFHVCTKL